MEVLSENGPENLRSGFKKPGIYPTDANVILNGLPSSDPVDVPGVSVSVIEHLEQMRDDGAAPERKRREKVNVLQKCISVRY